MKTRTAAECPYLQSLVAAVLVLGVAPGLLLNTTAKDVAAITTEVSR